jgi:membrane-associated phospholipid phosphatase
MPENSTRPSIRDSRARIATAAVVASILLTIAFLDRPFASASHALLARPAWAIWLTYLADVPDPAAVLGLGVTGIAWLAGWRPGRLGRMLLAACLATLAASTAKDVLKEVAGRPWPEPYIPGAPSWIGTGTFGFFPFHGGRGFASFPSGHTTVITAPCAALWRSAGRFAPALILPPFAVAIGLLGADYHFLSDCIAGAALGTACALTVNGLILRAGE